MTLRLSPFTPSAERSRIVGTCAYTRGLTMVSVLATAAACSAGGPASDGAEIASNSSGAGGGAMGTLVAPSGVGAPNTTGGVLLTESPLVETDDCDSLLEVTYRDFTEAHPDFEMDYSGDGVRRKLIAPQLGANGKPVFLSSFGCPFDRNSALDCNNNTPSNQEVINTAESFSQWYQDTEGVNQAIAGTLQLTETQQGSGLYVFNSTSFFPLGQDEGFGAGPNGRDKNFLFTTEIHLNFSYTRGQKFSFRGDDDLWIFVNGQLAMDLGSMHGPENGEIDFDAQAGQLGISPGGAYAMDIFHAERHTDGSNFGFETNIACFTRSAVY